MVCEEEKNNDTRNKDATDMENTQNESSDGKNENNESDVEGGDIDNESREKKNQTEGSDEDGILTMSRGRKMGILWNLQTKRTWLMIKKKIMTKETRMQLIWNMPKINPQMVTTNTISRV